MSIYFNDELKYKSSILNEAYFGKNDNFIEMEKQIGIIREKCKKFTDINKSEEVQTLNRLFEKQFGMDVFALHVIQEDIINAYTIPVARNFDMIGKNMSKMVIATKKDGYKFKKDNGLCIMCCVYLGVLKNETFTNGEILAIMLHELGHNFADCIHNKIRLDNQQFMKDYLSIFLFDAIISSIISFGALIPVYIQMYKNNTNDYKLKQEKNKKSSKISGILSGISGSINDFYNVVNGVLNRLTGSSLMIRLSVKLGAQEKNDSLDRQNEVIGDKFAGIYGYGPEQSSALLKMENIRTKTDKIVEKIPVIGRMINNDFHDSIKDLHLIDCHPQVIQRINSEISLLKDELKRGNLDPKLEKVIKDQIKDMEDIIKKATKSSEDLQGNEVAQAAYNAYIKNECPDAVSKKIDKSINDMMDKIVK